MCPNHKWYQFDCSWCRALVRIIQLERELGTDEASVEREVETDLTLQEYGVE